MKIYTDFYEMLMDITTDVNNGITVWIDRDYSCENTENFYKEEPGEGNYFVSEFFDLDRMATEIAKIRLNDPSVIVTMVYHWEYMDDEPIPFKLIQIFKTND